MNFSRTCSRLISEIQWLNCRFSRTHGSPDNTHLAVEPLSDDSACSSDSDASEAAGSGSGFRIKKKRKQPTRLITVREMNTV